MKCQMTNQLRIAMTILNPIIHIDILDDFLILFLIKKEKNVFLV